MKAKDLFLTDAQLKAEVDRCLYCQEKPCRTACPADCSPADFIMAVKVGGRSDYKRAAALIMGNNPLGGVCGAVCPDKHCMKACSRHTFDTPINIPAAQAAIIRKARELGVMPEFAKAPLNGKKIAVVGGGPAGLAAAAGLGQKGYKVDIYDSGRNPGGMANLIPDFRLDKKTLSADVKFNLSLGDIHIKRGDIGQPAALLAKNYDAVIVSAGLGSPIKLGVPGEEAAVNWLDYLGNTAGHKTRGRKVAVIGGGAVAADCAMAAAAGGAVHVEMFALEKLGEMPLTHDELDGLQKAGVQISGRIRVSKILKSGKKVKGLETVKVALPGGKFDPRLVRDVKGARQLRGDIDLVIIAIGSRPAMPVEKTGRVFYAGDIQNGATTVVEAVAAGKNCAMEVDACLTGGAKPKIESRLKSRLTLDGRRMLPVPLETEFFGRKIISPFLLSAAPPSDGYEQMKKAYEAGWPGGVMKTAFDNLQIHIPSEYMFALTKLTYANCDNVSGHPLERVCREIGKLRAEFPDRLTMASTGGPVSGNDEADKKVWQSNTRKLEAAGAMGIEYSLSCPQGGDGTKGDIVSQDAELTAKIIGWVMETGAPDVPKLFKLTAAVTSIYPIIMAIKEVFAKYPGKKAGVTLANTFPTLAFRNGRKDSWEEGIVVGMSGEGAAPISNLTLANVSKLGVAVSGNGGPMDYKAAAHFLALGAKTVQFCTIAMKHGYGIIDELHSGLSHLMEERSIRSVKELIGRALPDPVTGFMELSAVKKISAVNDSLCQHCGNCARCPYMAITLDKKLLPRTDASKCVGCSICVQSCFAGALYMRERTSKETKMLCES